jgi:hypothetical protein
MSKEIRSRALVGSSCVASVGYCTKTGTLEVEFRSGTIYRYDRVPVDIYRGFLDAQSKGHFFHRFIKTRYPFKRMNS